MSVLKNGADTRDLNIGFQSPITVGTFINRDRPSFIEAMNKRFGEVFGPSYKPYPEGAPRNGG
jgi:2-oxoglutarate ferredoxin oxidoreductase subunit beta